MIYVVENKKTFFQGYSIEGENLRQKQKQTRDIAENRKSNDAHAYLLAKNSLKNSLNENILRLQNESLVQYQSFYIIRKKMEYLKIINRSLVISEY